MATIEVLGARWNYKRVRSLREFVSCECVNCNKECDFAYVSDDGFHRECPICKSVYAEPPIEVYWELKRKRKKS